LFETVFTAPSVFATFVVYRFNLSIPRLSLKEAFVAFFSSRIISKLRAHKISEEAIFILFIYWLAHTAQFVGEHNEFWIAAHRNIVRTWQKQRRCLFIRG